jgi:hypothetical protein
MSENYANERGKTLGDEYLLTLDLWQGDRAKYVSGCGGGVCMPRDAVCRASVVVGGVVGVVVRWLDPWEGDTAGYVGGVVVVVFECLAVLRVGDLLMRVWACESGRVGVSVLINWWIWEGGG